MSRTQAQWLLLFLSIILLGLLLRYFATYNNAFMDTESPVFFSMMQQTAANNFVVPKLNALSGFPMHNIAPERPLLTYLGLFHSSCPAGR